MLNVTYSKNQGAVILKIRIISERADIETLAPNERIVHIAFRPSNADIFQIVEACPKIEAIQLPKSYRRTVSRSIEMFLGMQNVAVLEGDVWGHRKDICEYRVVPRGALDDIAAMTLEGVDRSRIMHDVGLKYKLSPSLIEFAIKKGITA